MRFLGLLPLLAVAACASTPAPISHTTTTAASIVSVDCGSELPGFDKIAAAPLVVLGELHGQSGPPAFAANLACREATHAKTAMLALEISAAEQPRIDAFLASDGGDAAKSALLDGPFWTRTMQDGRSSTSMYALLDKVRAWNAGGLALRVAAIDVRHGPNQRESEHAMASALVDLVREKRGPVVMLVGNLHARTEPGAAFDPGIHFMAGIAQHDVPDLVTLDERYGTGESWMCFSATNPNECGPKPVTGPGSGPIGAIDIFAKPDDHGFTGTYSVGAAEAAEPARGLTDPQKIAELFAQFRAANRPRNEDRPSESALDPHDRNEWCARLLPVAKVHVPLDGDRLDRISACDAVLVASEDHQVVPLVKIKYDLNAFFARPSFVASYDRETRTLYLPLSAAYEPWTDGMTAKHEWLHARHHFNARNGFTLDSALMTYANGFTADEVPVVLCDVIHHTLDGERMEKAEHEVRNLRVLLDTLGTMKKKGRLTRAGVAGTTFGSVDGVERWVGGKDAKKSLAVLEGVWRDAATALLALKASPPDVRTATSVPLLAGDACDPSK